MLELRRERVIVLGDHERSDPLGCLVQEQGAGGRQRLELVERVAEILERRRRLVEAPEDDADDQSSGSGQGS